MVEDGRAGNFEAFLREKKGKGTGMGAWAEGGGWGVGGGGCVSKGRCGRCAFVIVPAGIHIAKKCCSSLGTPKLATTV